MRKFITYLFSFLCLTVAAQEQQDSLGQLFGETYQQLRDLQKKVFYSRTEKERLEANRAFLEQWEKIVDLPEALTYRFDGLTDVAILTSPQSRLRVITWNIPKDDGTQLYFGFILVTNKILVKKGLFRNKYQDEYSVYRLLDKSPIIKNPETHVGTADKWFGMLYVQMVVCDGYITLIGWDGNDKLTQRKFIDVLYFKEDGSPVFGKDVFDIPKKAVKRMMFEYSSDITMSVKYIERTGQIVFSHLAPRERGDVLEGQYQFYGPDAEFDGLEQKSDRWVFVANIDIRSDKADMPESKKPNPKKQTPVYRPR